MTAFANYDSGAFPTIEGSILHSRTNLFLLKNFSKRVSAGTLTENYIISEPSCSLKDFIGTLSEFFVSNHVKDSEIFRPESVSKRIYGTVDFWYLLLLINKIPSATEFTTNNILVLPPEYLYKIEIFLEKNNNIVEFKPLEVVL